MYVERPVACTSLFKVQYRILPPLRGLIYQYCNTALHKNTRRSVGKCHQNTIILSAFPSIIFLKIKKLLKDWVKLDMAKYLLAGIYSIASFDAVGFGILKTIAYRSICNCVMVY